VLGQVPTNQIGLNIWLLLAVVLVEQDMVAAAVLVVY
jgi:hypothetical protein